MFESIIQKAEINPNGIPVNTNGNRSSIERAQTVKFYDTAAKFYTGEARDEVIQDI